MEDKSILLPQCDNIEIKTFDDVTPYVAASFKENMWVLRVFERPVAESDIAEFVKNIRSLDRKVRKKVLVALSGMEENAKLLAKELKMSIWDLETLNMLFGLYGKKGIVIA
jgi:hypothetical protein